MTAKTRTPRSPRMSPAEWAQGKKEILDGANELPLEETKELQPQAEPELPLKEENQVPSEEDALAALASRVSQLEKDAKGIGREVRAALQHIDSRLNSNMKDIVEHFGVHGSRLSAIESELNIVPLANTQEANMENVNTTEQTQETQETTAAPAEKPGLLAKVASRKTAKVLGYTALAVAAGGVAYYGYTKLVGSKEEEKALPPMDATPDQAIDYLASAPDATRY